MKTEKEIKEKIDSITFDLGKAKGFSWKESEQEEREEWEKEKGLLQKERQVLEWVL